MRRQLDRLLRIRHLLEHLSQVELQRNAEEVRRLELAVERQRRLVLAARSEALASLETDGAQTTPAWLVGVADAEMLRWKRARTGALAASHRPALEVARQEMLARRLERRQAETMAAAEETAREKKRRRREQNLVDDWFQSRIARNRPESD